MTTSLQPGALNGLWLVNYSSLGLLYPRWYSVSPTADKSESDRDIKIAIRMESWGGTAPCSGKSNGASGSAGQGLH